MALDDCFLLSFMQSTNWAPWDPPIFAVPDSTHLLHPPVTESPAAPSSSSEASTGYLQDAVAGWSERGKRRRTASSPSHDPIAMNEELHHLLQDFWDVSGNVGDAFSDLGCVIQENNFVSDDPFTSEGPTVTVPRCQATQKLAVEHHNGREAHGPRDQDHLGCDLKKKATGVAYPFTVVKPGGIDGDVTLDDINERIMMRPARPVRHPVGEFAPGPVCVSPDALGLSGKAIVSLTRIHTRGTGTITIIRTKG